MCQSIGIKKTTQIHTARHYDSPLQGLHLNILPHLEYCGPLLIGIEKI